MKTIRSLRFLSLWITCVAVIIKVDGGKLNAYVQKINSGSMPIVTFSDQDRIEAAKIILEERMRGVTTHSLATPTSRWLWAADRFPLIIISPLKVARDANRISNHFPNEITIGFYSLGDIMIVKGEKLSEIFAVITFTLTIFLFATKNRRADNEGMPV